MANDVPLTLIGNLSAPPELRFTPSGAAVASFTIASTPRHFDKRSNEWVDDETLWMRCTAWRDLAEHIAESLDKGMRVIAQGRLQQRSYQTRDGENRTVVEMQVDEIGPSLRRATVKVQRIQANGQGGSPGGNGSNQGSTYTAPQGGTQDDPWATGTTTSFGDEPPY